MSPLEFLDPLPLWNTESPSEPVDAAVLDLGYEVAFPFLARPDAAPRFHIDKQGELT